MMHSVYGVTEGELRDRFMLKFKTAMDNLSRAALASNFLVNIFPALARVPDWFPWTGWKRTAREWREQRDDTLDSPYNWTKAEVEKNVHEPPMIESMLAHAERLGLNLGEAEDYVKEIAFSLVGGGTDTGAQTANAILVFFVAMLLFPETQAKAQEEVDRVIGTQRLPTMEDRARLPYVGRLVQEVLRWRPIAPLGVPHACFQGDVYKGYRIPKGAIVLPAVIQIRECLVCPRFKQREPLTDLVGCRAMSRDTAVYKDPETFEPDRFLDPSVPLSSTFGFGRRYVWSLDFCDRLEAEVVHGLGFVRIEMAKDEQGNDIVPVPDGENGIA
ncbi:hypothetical protein FRC10_007416 [Ceratobasidium sp. 414]|nr:hypothetical protein FRC10_007416 [Ceratobasidium sp. 414]